MQTGTDNGEKGSCCPVTACGNLPMERKVMVVGGILVALLSFLAATMAPGLVWLVFLLGAAMIYGGLSGNCLLTKALCRLCGKKEACSTEKGDCGS